MVFICFCGPFPVSCSCSWGLSSGKCDATASLNRHSRLQLLVGGGAANADFDRVRLDDERLPADIPVRERLRRQSQFHRPGLARLDRDAPEAAQFLQRPFDLGLEMLDVELHDFFAGDLAAVLHVNADVTVPSLLRVSALVLRFEYLKVV